MTKILFFVLVLSLVDGKVQTEQYPVEDAQQCVTAAQMMTVARADENVIVACAGLTEESEKA